MEVEYIVLEIRKSFKHTVVGKFPFARPLHVSAYCNLATEIEPNCLTLVSMEDEALVLIQKGKLLLFLYKCNLFPLLDPWKQP